MLLSVNEHLEDTSQEFCSATYSPVACFGEKNIYSEIIRMDYSTI